MGAGKGVTGFQRGSDPGIYAAGKNFITAQAPTGHAFQHNRAKGGVQERATAP